MELKIKTFMKDSHRPGWLLRLLLETRWYMKDWKGDKEGMFNMIETIIKGMVVVRWGLKYSLSTLVTWEIDGNKMTVFSSYIRKPVVEFTVE